MKDTIGAVDRVGVVAAFSKPEARQLGDEISDWLRQRGVAVVPEADLREDAAAHVDAIIALGGDGLMMRTASVYPDVPLLGINFGNVGFLAVVERRDWQAALEALLAGRLREESGATLAATLVRAAESTALGGAINDVVVRAGPRMIDIEVYVDGHYVNTFPGDGMIVSTPHGSTAYGMAAGGPILTAGVRGFAIVPISCHSPIRMPFVVSEDAVIELVLANDRAATLILDGREVAPVHRGDAVRVVRGPHQFRRIAPDSANFYDAFRTKFNYKIRPEAVPSRLDAS